jgi:hypothetical protein
MSLNHVPEKVVGKFRIKLMPSMFTARNGKTDIVIRAINPENWGACINGKFYTICLILAHEDHHIVSDHQRSVSDEILSNLKAWGF